jgi:hypothetical protein
MGATIDRHSWCAAHTRWQADDRACRAKGEQVYRMKRALYMPPALDGRLDRMLKRITSNAALLDGLERRGVNGPAWIRGDGGLAHTRRALAESVSTLLRHVYRHPDHPKGGLYGYRHEFAPMIRRFLKGQDDDETFKAGMGWALRLLARETDSGEE